jgi:WhiB family redox-sensing transcriptional regulator
MGKPVDLLVRPDWWASAACAGVGPELFFAPDPGSERAAKAICARCGASGPCRAWAVEHRMKEGVFGGLNSVERRKLASAPGAMR